MSRFIQWPLAALLLLGAGGAVAQQAGDDSVDTPSRPRAPKLATAERPADAAKVISLYDGAAPGSESWTWQEQVSNPPWGGGGGRLVRNVVQPTLAVFQPPNPARATRTAVIIAPGGGFRWLSIDSEGYDVARALAAQGDTAIVLKYRLNHTANEEEAFREEALAFIRGIPHRNAAPAATPGPRPSGNGMAPDPRLNPGVADGVEAVRYVRKHAAELGVDPDRIGIMGFSAGAIVTHGVVLHHDEESRPNFAGQIYFGAQRDTTWPQDTPPMFLAVAADDFAHDSMLDAYTTLRAQKHSVEFHIFARGGHGFGLQRRGFTSDLWLEEFAAWLDSMGLRRPPPPSR